MAINDYTADDFNADLIIENEKLREQIEVLEIESAKMRRQFGDYVCSARSVLKVLKERLKNDVSVEMQ